MEQLLRVSGLKTYFHLHDHVVRAVDGVDFSLKTGETLGIVGESGCGKSVTSLSLMRLVPEPPGRIEGGSVLFQDRELLSLPEQEMRSIRGNRISMIFQEPMTSLNPVFSIGFQLSEVLMLHKGLSKAEALAESVRLLDSVGISDPAERVAEYPFQLSGGLRQRVMIAMAMACEPAVIIADEPTTALDVTIQAQILRLMRDLKEQHDTSILFITHDLAVIAAFTGRGGSIMSRLIDVYDLRKIFPIKAGAFSNKKLMLKAVDGVSFHVDAGETLGLVGESGCGKTTIGRTILRLYEADGGRVFVKPDDPNIPHILELDSRIKELTEILEPSADLLPSDGNGGRMSDLDRRSLKREIRTLRHEADEFAAGIDLLSMPRGLLKQNRRTIQMVFQDPWASLNPRMLVQDLIAEGPREFKTYVESEIDGLVRELLDKVGLPTRAASKYPHEFSGGQRQRIGIARALAVNPNLIVCDEPVSALDVSIQAQILNLLITLQDDFDLAYIFIAHDLSVVQYVSDRVAVMYLGRIMEIADSVDLYSSPRHSYTVSLLQSVPVADPDVEIRGTILEGDVPSPVNPPPGCTFHPRCPNRIEICSQVRPDLVDAGGRHRFACHNPVPPSSDTLSDTASEARFEVRSETKPDSRPR